jgi:hypothetical protein
VNNEKTNKVKTKKALFKTINTILNVTMNMRDSIRSDIRVKIPKKSEKHIGTLSRRAINLKQKKLI